MENAHRKWMRLAREVARTFSKDRSTQIGCVIVGQDDILRSTGYNGFIRGLDDKRDAFHERPAKYTWTVHAETNAIANAARLGIAIGGCKLYTSMASCSKCAPIIVQAGIAEVICYGLNTADNFEQTNKDTRHVWLEEAVRAQAIFEHGNVKLTFILEHDQEPVDIGGAGLMLGTE